ncbi:hypothetical protein C2845_PM01G04820 [Panicum miliaceum]|uniref:Uncharacterized protein n=1 Tax=Panicum miliaceum TaxID=4540 RepID=A0A3L6TPA2_PANMI|nr:hypothetical protein C2845_PM01G04820 [Panicum miliaceum]
MEGGGFDLFSQEPLSAGSNVWPSQPLATDPAHAPAPRAGLDSLDLNSQVPQGEEFLHLHDYDAYLRGNNMEGAGSGRGSSLFPPRAPRSLGVPDQRAGGRAGWAARGAALHARQLNFSASSAAAGNRATVGDYIDVDEEGAWEEEVEDLGNSDGPPLKNQIGMLKSIYSFWGYMQSHTGLGRKPDGSVDADSDYWRPYLDGKSYLKKVLKGPPANLDQLEEMFSGNTVDGSTAFVPGDDYGEGHEGAWAEEAEEDYVQTLRSSSSQIAKRERGLLAVLPVLVTVVKKSKSPMVQYVKNISVTFKEVVQVNNKKMLKRAADKEDEDAGSTSSSEDEITSMCRKNLKMIQNLVVQMVPIFVFYFEIPALKLILYLALMYLLPFLWNGGLCMVVHQMP